MSIKKIIGIPLFYSLLFLNYGLKAQNTISDSIIFKNTDAYFTALTSMNKFSGSVLISRKGKIILRKGYGMANYENDIPNTSKTVYRICSLSKQFTAMAILQLEEKGLLKVEDPVEKYIPNFPHGDIITIHHLLSHTSGVPREKTAIEQVQFLSTSELVDYEKEVADTLLFEPGKGFYYSNVGYYVLAFIIEKTSGITFEKYMTENIFEPLGMKHSGHYDHKILLKNRAYGYTHRQNNLITVDYTCFNCQGAGSLYSTVEDLNIWEEQKYSGKLIREKTLAKMLTPYSKSGYGYGISIDKKFNHNSYEHNGALEGYSTYLLRLPDDSITIIYLSNFGDIPLLAINKDIVAIALGEKYNIPGTINRKIAKIDPLIYKNYEGEYQFEIDATQTLKIICENNRVFMIDKSTNEKQEIFPEAENIFFVKPTDEDCIEFVKNEQNKITYLIFGAYGGAKYKANKIK